MDPIISAASWDPRLLTSARVAALLPERSWSLNIVDGDHEVGSYEGGGPGALERRGRSASPIRANVKRRRSVASAPGDVLARQPSSQSFEQPSSRGRRKLPAMPLSQQNQPSDSEPKGVSTFQALSAPSRSSRSPGPTISQPIPYPAHARSPKRRRVTRSSETPQTPTTNRDKGFVSSPRVIRGSTRSAETQLNSERKNNNQGLAYETKGAFRLKKGQRKDEFRLPKSQSEPKSLWLPGDGFSDEETRSDFVLPMAGGHKRKRSRSLPIIGKLQLESEDVCGPGSPALGSSRVMGRYPAPGETRLRRGVAKDIWPTVDDFSEELDVRAHNTGREPDDEVVPSTMSPQPTLVPLSRENFRYVPPSSRKRNHCEFENFGRWPLNGGFGDTVAEELSGPARVPARVSYGMEDGDESGDGERGGGEVSEEEEDEMEDEDDEAAVTSESSGSAGGMSTGSPE
ncbi:hypothetical protein GGS23DRAFT_545279 [Durotheca rogersii]|uniref:uncharacterized protein n=1 Tax=Durotheca rogersii TaxID=419775 RepID=UPI00221FBAD3|nr:uncharacterized protein GGS23DRAFT_545279 [Durotheca rogersii]KAI5868396.1 hypothetical protein GGS23DRAFT_545279 [Durotheca rogersii]